MNINEFNNDLIKVSKWAFTTRRVNRDDGKCLTTDFKTAKPGDLVLCEVMEIGSHKRIQLSVGRYSKLYLGDRIVLAVGSRYAPDQYEGIAELDENSSDMLAGGGVIGLMRKANQRMSQPTKVKPIGIISDSNSRPINIADYALVDMIRPKNITAIAAVGSSMNGGKTTAVASFAHGLSRAGYKVATIKVTGTGSFGDFNTYLDTKAHFVADFVDAGMVSTYKLPLKRIITGMNCLLGHAAAAGCDVALIEFADGIFQIETMSLLKSPEVREIMSGYIFASPCAASAVGGCEILRSMEIEPSIVTGIVSRSPLAVEEVEKAAAVSVTSRESLLDASTSSALLERMRCSDMGLDNRRRKAHL